MSKKYKVEKIEENKKAEAEIKGSVPADIFKEYVANELKEIQKGYEAKGFRKGKVPIDVIEKTINKDQLLNEAANSALKDIYLDIIKESEIDVMGLPQISITKMAEGNDLG
ncbi:MAG: trigger factor family protein, partial [Candidatus Paceibacterota bacterium]